MFPIAPPPPSGNVFPIPPSKEKQALLARQVAEEMREDGIDAVYVDAIPRGAIPHQSQYVDNAAVRSLRKTQAAQNAAHPEFWSINTREGRRFFTPRHYVSPSKVAGQVTVSRMPGPGSKEFSTGVLEAEEGN